MLNNHSVYSNCCSGCNVNSGSTSRSGSVIDSTVNLVTLIMKTISEKRKSQDTSIKEGGERICVHQVC